MNLGASFRSFRLRLTGAFLTICTIVFGSVPTAKAVYTFTQVADSTGPLGNIFFDSVTLNATGTAAFQAYLDNGSRGVFAGNGGPLTAITLTSLPFASFGNPSINQAGTVAFVTFPNSGFPDGIYSGNGGPLTTIAGTSGPLRDFAGGYTTSINVTGTVTFYARQDSGPAGIFSGNGGAVTPIFLNSPSASVDFSFSMNDAGTLAFRSGLGARVVTANGGLITTIADNSGQLNYFGWAPSLNEAGTVAFAAGVGGPDGGVSGIYSGSGGPLTTIADLSGPFSSFSFNDFTSNQPSINDTGVVAFLANLDAGGFGIYTGDGTGTSEIIGSGDPLFGSTIAALGISPISLNDLGQVAFYYRLANGTTGIAIANPVPEPSSGVLLLLGLALGLTRRCLRKYCSPAATFANNSVTNVLLAH